MSSTTDNEQRFAYLLSPEFELVNSAGKPLTGGWIEVYMHGTRNKYYCFSDFNGTLHPFQIPLDSLGSNVVLASPLHAYDVYVYNRFGSLVMSRYNIVPATNSADAIADIVVIDSPSETLNVTVDGGTNWHLDVNTDLIATASGLAEVSGNLQDQIDGKKDLQLPYAATGTVTKTITKIEQNENGEIEVTYEDIELPPEVPNINITSPSGTIDVTSTTNPLTNTKTFKIDIHKTKMDFFDGYCGKSHYEDRSSSSVAAFGLYVDEWSEYNYQGDFIANSWQDENNTTFKLNSGLYLITASIRYQMAEQSVKNDAEYIRIATGAYNGLENGTRFKDWSSEYTNGECSIQLSFVRNVEDNSDYTYMDGNHDLYFYPYLPVGVNYAFIDHLQIVKLDSIAAFGGGSGPRYSPGYGIEILDDVIQVATGTVITNNYFNTVVSSINNEINEINTTIQNVTGDITELSETVTNIVGVTGDFVNRDEFNTVTGDITNINEAITNIIGATGDYATTDYVDAAVSGLENYSAGQYISIEDHVINVTGLQPEGDYATHDELNNVIETVNNVTGDITNINEAVTNIIGATGDYATQEYVDEAVSGLENYTAGQYISIEDHVINVTGLQPEGDYATHDELNEVVSTVNNVTGDITNINEAITNIIGATGDYATEEYVDEAIAAVTGGQFEQQQSDWTQADDTKVDYIKHKPREVNLVAGDNIAIEQDGLDVIISATGIGDVYEAGQYISIQNGTISATGLQPAGNYATEEYVDEAVSGHQFEQVNSDWLATSGVAEILNKPDVFQLIAGDNIDITPSGNDLVISAESDVTKAYVDEQIAAVSAAVPEAQVNSDWNATSGKAQILNKPDVEDMTIKALVAGENVDITVSGDYVVISASGDVSKEYVDTQIDAATGLIPTDTVSHAELNEAVDSVTGLIPEAQVNADWLATSGKAEILNKPQEEAVEFEEVNLSDYALASAIPDVSDFVTQQDVDNTVAPVQAQIDDLAAATGDYLQSSDLDGYATEQYVDDAIDAATGLIPDVSDFVTQQDIDDSIAPVQSQIDTLAAATGDYLTEQVNSDWNATSGVAEILNKPESEDVEFEEVNLSDYALASAIPSLDGYATETYVNNEVAPVQAQIDDLAAATGDYLTEQVNADWDATSGVAEILNKPQAEEVTFEAINLSDYALASAIPSLDGYATEAYVEAAVSAVTGGAEYTAGDNIDITDNTISVTGTEDLTLKSLIAGDNVTITASGDNVILSVNGIEDSNILWATYGSTTYAEIQEARQAGKSVFVVDGLTIFIPTDRGDWINASFGSPLQSESGYPYLARVWIDTNSTWHSEQFIIPHKGSNGIVVTDTGNISVTGYATDEDVQVVQTQVDELAAATGDYLQSSDLDGYATEQFVVDAIAASGGTDYNAGDNIDITDNTISVTGTEDLTLMPIVAGNGINIFVSGGAIVVSLAQ